MNFTFRMLVLVILGTRPRHGKGGMSGPVVKAHSLDIVRQLRVKLPNTIIIGCGGVSCGADIMDYRRAGANLFQAYTGFVRGPNSGRYFIRRIARQYRELHFAEANNKRIAKTSA